MNEKKTIRYSEAFKLNVVGEIESGKFSGPYAARTAYQIRGSDTVKRWLRRYGRTDLLRRQVLITTMEEHDEKKALQKRVRELEKALADAHMKGLLDDAYLGIACERLGTEPSEFKKKAVTKLSGGPEGPRKGRA
jgi:transposase-like protein